MKSNDLPATIQKLRNRDTPPNGRDIPVGRLTTLGGKRRSHRNGLGCLILKKVRKHWDDITGMYYVFEHKNPIIEFDVGRLQILAYPAQDYLDGLSDRTREQTKTQYRQAIADGALMVFVRDDSQRVFRSYIFPSSDEGT